MKSNLCLKLLLLILLSILLLKNTYAQDYRRLNLPEGAKARLGKGKILDMKLSQDGNRLAIASTIGVNLYNINTGAEIVLLAKDTDLVGLLAFSPDGTALAYTSGEKKCYIWHVENRKLLLTINTNETSYKSIMFLSDGKTLVSRNWRNAFSYWDITTGKLLETFSPKASQIKIKGRIWHRAVDGVVNNNNSLIYAIGNHDGTISIQDGKTNQHIRTLVPKTNNSLFYTVGKEKRVQKPLQIVTLPQEPEQEKAEKPHPLNLRDDGKPFPIQYKMNKQSFSPEHLAKEPIKWVTDLKCSPNGKLLLSRCSYKTPRRDGASGTGGPTELWDIETGEQLAALPWRVNVKFSSDGKTLAILSERGLDLGRCDIWDLVDMHQIAEFQSISDVKFSGNGRTLLLYKGGSYNRSGMLEENGSFTIWDIAKQSELSEQILDESDLLVMPDDQLFSNYGRIHVTAKYNGIVEVWEIEKETLPRTLTTGYFEKFTGLAFSYDGKSLAGGSSGSIHLWETASGSKQNRIISVEGGIAGLTFHKENSIISVVSFLSTNKYDFNTGKVISTNSNQIPFPPSFGPSSHFDDGTAISFQGYVFSSKYTTLATNHSKENKIEIWNTDNGKKIGGLTGNASHSARGVMALTSKGGILATSDVFGQKYEVLLWDTDTDKRIVSLEMSKNFIDNLISRFTRPNIYALVFDNDGKLLAVGTENEEIQLWDVTTEKRVRILKTKHEYAICKLAFSPDGSILASGDTWGEINLWETTTGKHITTYKGHKRNISILVFAQNNKFLASTGLYDGTIMLWDVPTK